MMSRWFTLSPPTAIALIRISLGSWLVWQTLGLLDPAFVDTLPNALITWAKANPIGWLRWSLHHWVIPHADPIGTWWLVAQTLVGGSLIIGFLSRFSSMCAALGTAVLLGLTHHLGWAYQTTFTLLFATFIGLLWVPSGHYWGIDRWLFKAIDEEFRNTAPDLPRFKSKKQKKVVEALAEKANRLSNKAHKNREAPAAKAGASKKSRRFSDD